MAERRVLVVEDDHDLALVLIRMFAGHGLHALHAATGEDAVKLSRAERPDLMILDVGLPEGDGFDVVDALRRDNHLRNVPVVVYTARDLDENERARLQLGITEFLTKGRITPEEFDRHVMRMLDGLSSKRNEEAVA